MARFTETFAQAYIRTATYRQVVGLMRPERISRFVATRRLGKQTTTESIQFLTQRTFKHIHYEVDWKRGEQGAFPVRVLNRLLEERKVHDMLVTTVTAFVECPGAIERLNVQIRERYEELHTPDNRREWLKPTDKVFMRWGINSSDEAAKLYAVDQLNAAARQVIHGAIGVMDLKSITTERSLKYGEKERWDLNDDTLLRSLLRTLDREGWPESERMVEINGIRHIASPFALRIYHREKAEGWKLQREEEVNGK